MSSSLYLCSACIVIVQEHDGLALFPICTTTNEREGEREKKKRTETFLCVLFSFVIRHKVRAQGNVSSEHLLYSIEKERRGEKECSQVEGTTSFTVAGTSTA
jgi:hypothetical protein